MSNSTPRFRARRLFYYLAECFMYSFSTASELTLIATAQEVCPSHVYIFGNLWTIEQQKFFTSKTSM